MGFKASEHDGDDETAGPDIGRTGGVGVPWNSPEAAEEFGHAMRRWREEADARFARIGALDAERRREEARREAVRQRNVEEEIEERAERARERAAAAEDRRVAAEDRVTAAADRRTTAWRFRATLAVSLISVAIGAAGLWVALTRDAPAAPVVPPDAPGLEQPAPRPPSVAPVPSAPAPSVQPPPAVPR